MLSPFKLRIVKKKSKNAVFFVYNYGGNTRKSIFEILFVRIVYV